MAEFFAHCVSASSLRSLVLSHNLSTDPEVVLTRLLLNLHSDTLQVLGLDAINVSYSEGPVDDAFDVKVWSSVGEDAPRMPVIMAAFLRAAGQAQALRIVSGLPSVEESAYSSDSSHTRGCSALRCVGFDETALGKHGVHFIESVWRATRETLQDHPNLLLAQLLPEQFPISFEGCDHFPAEMLTLADLKGAFEMASVIIGDAFDNTAIAALGDPILRNLMRKKPASSDVKAVLKCLSGPKQAQGFRDGAHLPITVAEAVIFAGGSGRYLRGPAFALLTAARVLGCRVRPSPQEVRCGWFSLPSEIRRACLEQLPTLWVPSAQELAVSMASVGVGLQRALKLPRFSAFTGPLVGRILAYACDPRTIGYGRLPEATFLQLRLAEEAANKDVGERFLDQPKWTIAGAQRRWKPLDSRSRTQADLMGDRVGCSWEAEIFLRTIGLPEQTARLPGRLPERD